MKNIDIKALRHEAEYYGITPLIKRLILCEDLTQSSCGDVLFYGYLPPPSIPLQEPVSVPQSANDVSVHGRTSSPLSTSRVDPVQPAQVIAPSSSQMTNPNGAVQNQKPPLSNHTRNSSLDYRVSQRSIPHSHSRNPSLDLRHVRNSSADMNKTFKNDIGFVFSPHQGISFNTQHLNNTNNNFF